LVAQERALDESADAGAFVGVELVECFEVQTQGLVLGSAFVGIEEEVAGLNCERDGDGSQDKRHGLFAARIVGCSCGLWAV
jgi:hypothetical protein